MSDDTSLEDFFNNKVSFLDGLTRFLRTNAYDYNLEVLRGNVSGHAMVTIAGHNDDATTTSVVVAPSLTTADIDQSGLHATAITVDVASTDAADDKDSTGLRTLTLEGLDSDGNEQDEVITLEGQEAAREGLDAMRRLGTAIVPSQMPCTLPRGSGNDWGGVSDARFYPCPDDQILTETNRNILLEDDTDGS